MSDLPRQPLNPKIVPLLFLATLGPAHMRAKRDRWRHGWAKASAFLAFAFLTFLVATRAHL